MKLYFVVQRHKRNTFLASALALPTFPAEWLARVLRGLSHVSEKTVEAPSITTKPSNH